MRGAFTAGVGRGGAGPAVPALTPLRCCRLLAFLDLSDSQGLCQVRMQTI